MGSIVAAALPAVGSYFGGPIGGAIGSAIGGAIGGNQQSKAADAATAAQLQANQAAIAEQQRQFNAMQANLQPYMQAGQGSLTGQQALLGLSGAPAQQAAIAALSNSPQMAAYLKQGENAMLQTASATGGLRGGNLQAAMAQFRPQLLSQMINQQFANLGGLTSMGQSSAAGVVNAGMQSAANIGNFMQNIGNAQAGNAMAQAGITNNMIGSIGNALGGVNWGSVFGGGGAAMQPATTGSMSGFYTPPPMGF